MVKKILAYSYVYLILLLMYVPILVLIVFSFTNATYIGTWNGFSFELYAQLFESEEIMIAIGNTVIIAVISAICSTILGTLGAVGGHYLKRKGRAVLENINQIPVGQNLFSFWTLLAGHIVISAPFVYLNVKPKLLQMDPSLYEAALDLGCNPRKALYKVVLPEILPGIFSGFMLAITLSLDDFIVTAFTRGSGLLSGANNIETISTLVQAKIKKGPIPPEMRALTTIIFLIVLLVVIGISLYRNKGTSYKNLLRKRLRERKD